MDFGKYAILDQAEYHFEKEPEWYWRFRPATSLDELVMSRFFNENLHWMEVMFREIATLFGGTNIPGEDGKPVLQESASVEEVERVLHDMPSAMVQELWVALGKAVPFWGPKNPIDEDSPEEPTGEESSSS